MAVDLSADRAESARRRDLYDVRGTEAYDWGIKERKKVGDTADTGTATALDTSKAYAGYSKEDQDTYRGPGGYKDAMKGQLDFATNYASEGRKKQNQAAAITGVRGQFKQAQAQAEAHLEGLGINPSSGRFAGLDAGLDAAEAGAGAAAGYKAGIDTEMQGQALLDNAIGRGSVLPGQAANEAGLSTAAAQAGVGMQTAGKLAGKSLIEPTGWIAAGDAEHRDIRSSWMDEDKSKLSWEELELKKKEAEQKSSSGIGAGLGAATGILSMAGNMFMPGMGSMAGGIFSGMMGGMGGGAARRGGLIAKRFAEGGSVTSSVDDIPDFLPPLPMEEGDGMQGYAEGGDVLPEDEDEFVDSPEEEMGEPPMDAPTPGVGSGGGDRVVTPEMSPSGGAETDDVHALLNEGEFVIPKDVVRWQGEKFFQKLIEKSYAEMQQPKIAEPEEGPPTQAIALSPPTFKSGAPA